MVEGVYFKNCITIFYVDYWVYVGVSVAILSVVSRVE